MIFEEGEKKFILFLNLFLAFLYFTLKGWWVLVIYSFSLFAMLDVPCGLKFINRNSLLWNIRQLMFLSLAVFALIIAIGML